ncbi:MAG: hypothetical protein IPG17_19820 [Sandaracinaceae bacterium]|jgi:hypothetical protein|nr:hypothetical protein [Sandaracinaceae bacterium]MBK6808246.1 hypothetical protein [Sandaracinaceae bacterium]MBK7151906.1 hypothetical protein [Sandaracinaceae bacterium]MBK7779034.1 hypothetical protein [Sandaracinaceae bacterium]MBK8589523.1 hypothetical protein [Sandaracinaceae bacterium]
MTSSRIDPQQSVSVRLPSERQTPLPASRRFREALDEGAQRIVASAASLTGVSPLSQSTTASRVAPGRAALSEAGDSGLPDLAPEVGSSSGSSAGSSATGVPDDTMELLEMQRRIGAEQVHFSTLSNVLKARHDTAKSVVGNIR